MRCQRGARLLKFGDILRGAWQATGVRRRAERTARTLNRAEAEEIEECVE
jgi:hypothetical protein